MAWSSVLGAADSKTHVVQFYGADDRLYLRNVCDYLSEGLKRREGLVVVATPDHARAFALHLTSAGVFAATGPGRVAFLDAHRSLVEIMTGPDPDADRFEAVVGAAVRDVAARSDHRRVRAYGEMAGLLWSSGQVAAAVRLEEYWNQLLRSESCSLFCGYPTDVVGPGRQQAEADAVLRTHTHFIPLDRELEEAVDASVGDVIGSDSEGVRQRFKAAFEFRETPPSLESVAEWLQLNLPDHAAGILERMRAYAVGTQALAP